MKDVTLGFSMNKDSQSPIEVYLVKLKQITSLLREIGLLIFILTLGNIFAAYAAILSFWKIDDSLLKYLPTVSVFVCLMLIALHEYLKKAGNIIFEEVSDELQWMKITQDKEIKQEHNEDAIEANLSLPFGDMPKRPSINTRVILKSFSRSSDLPFIPGRFGALMYANFNLFCLFLEAFFRSRPLPF